MLASKKIIWPACLFFIFVISAGLVGYGWWLFRIEKANRAYRAGEMPLAAERYEAAEFPFRYAPWLTYLLRDDFENLIFNQVAALHARGQYPKAVEKLQQGAEWAPFLIESGEYSFWSGNLLFRRAAASKKPEDVLNNLKSALGEYQRGLQASPEHWDLKYNYELVKMILSQRDQSPNEQQEKVKSILDKMRPVKDPAKEELPPEKRG